MARHASLPWPRSLIQSIGRALARSASEAVALVFPVACAGCGTADAAVCGPCKSELLSGVLRREVAGTLVFSAAAYLGPVKRMLLAFKRHGRTDAAGALAAGLARAIDAALEASEGGGVELVPVPATRRGDRARGYRPVELMLKRAGYRPSRVLRWKRRPRDQIGLGIRSRNENLGQALGPRRELAGRRFIVIDDVVTTGATLAEAVRAVREGGGHVVACATVASTPRRRDSPGGIEA
ncbi:comF family protein [Paramicrobacterium humi]|uniref:ComF family protein n=1 Tax=Paramicrobacterium humi TaxID=640635 RepID=A0A1H4P3Q9_9MICO|nr:phosphoribosyltransferase family protein [Microbacterium humi]SEC02081.1 comF family protein [Microbacterium humi]